MWRYSPGRWGGVPAGDGQLLQASDFSGFNLCADGGEIRVEATVETEHERGLSAADLVAAHADAVDIQIDGLFAQGGDAGANCPEESG